MAIIGLLLLSGTTQSAAAQSAPAQPEEIRADETLPRFALVIGNAAYTRMGTLRNAVNDAERVAEALRETGFLVTTVVNADRRMMMREVRALATHLSETEGVGLFYYAGHAVQIDGENYLIPIGSDIVTEQDVEFESVSLASILAHMENGNGLSILMLDACRDNPFVVAATRGSTATRGLSVVDALPAGAVIMYATSPNEVAIDGEGENSPFAEAIIANVRTPGLDLDGFLNRVGADVVRATGGRQVPHVSKLYFGDFRFVPPGGSAVGGGTSTSLLVSGLPADSTIRVGDRHLSASGTTTIADLPAGAYELRVETPFSGEGYTMEVRLETATPAIVEIPTATAEVSGIVPETTVRLNGVVVDVAGERSTFRLLPGEYTMEVTGRYVDPYYRVITLHDRQRVTVQLDLTEYGVVAPLLPDGEVEVEVHSTTGATTIAWNADDPQVAAGTYEFRARWADDVDWGFTQPISVAARATTRVDARSLAYSPTYRIGGLSAERSTLEGVIATGRRRTVASNLGFAGAAAGGVLGVVSYIIARSAYVAYQATGDSADALLFASRVRTFNALLLGGAGAAVAGTALGIILRVIAPDTDAAVDRVFAIDHEIERLGGTP